MSGIMQYLGELVRSQLEHDNPVNVPDEIQIDILMEIALRNHMENLILGALLKLELSEENKSAIKPVVIQSALISMIQMRCLSELEDSFEKAEIYHQPLKGSVLKNLYPSPEMREMSDIDIMVYDVNLERAKRVVEEMGFILLESVKHHDIYIKSPLLIIELHHALYDKDVDKVQYEYFKSKKQLLAKEGKKYALQFSIEDFYIYLIAHMAKHFYETGCGIRNIVDVYYYRKLYEVTWNQTMIATELEKCGLTTFESRIHTLARVWLGEEKADLFSEKLFDYMLDCGIYGKGEYGIWGQLAILNHSDPVNYQSYSKRWYCFPPLAYMERDYVWLKKYPFLLGVTWVIRGLHGLFSKDGREKGKMLLNIDAEKVRTMNEIYKGMKLDFKKELS